MSATKITVNGSRVGDYAPVCFSDRDANLDLADSAGNVIARFNDGHIQTKYFNSRTSEYGGVKYVDCLGDSLTMGASHLGWFEDKLQELLGSNYIVRNWGVGGETKSTIMVRQGSASVKFASDFTLPASTEIIQLPAMTSTFDGGQVLPLLQGSTVSPEHTSKMVNPCYLCGIECTMTNSNTTYYIKRNTAGTKTTKICTTEPLLMNTGKEMSKAYCTIVWMGTNGEPTTEQSALDLVEAYKKTYMQMPTKNFIFIGLHLLSQTSLSLAKYFENAMFKEFGNKFFNLREYCCTNMLYDAGITPTSNDLQNMSNGICPASALYDTAHFKPVTNAQIGRRLYEIMLGLGYLK